MSAVPAPAVPAVRRLSILYDGRCTLCLRCKVWLQRQPAFVALEFVDQNMAACGRRFPTLVLRRAGDDAPEELVVVADDGRVWRGGGAWLMVLWALRAYRPLSVRLARSPAGRVLARRAFALVSAHRDWVGRRLDPQAEARLEAELPRAAAVAFEERTLTCRLGGANATTAALRAVQARTRAAQGGEPIPPVGR